MFGCDNPLEQKVTDLEDRVAELEAEQELLEAEQELLVSSILDLQTYIDSLNTDQQAYIDSLHNEQQIMLENLALSALNAGFIETDVYSGSGPTDTWTDLDLSSVVTNTTTLALIKLTVTSGHNVFVGFRPDGSSEDWGYNPNNLTDSVTMIRVGTDSTTGLALVTTDSNGIVEWARYEPNNVSANIVLSTLFYLNQ